MLKIREVIVVEGRCDVSALKRVVDAVILETGGFAIFNDRQKQKLLRRLAESRGLIVLTDSDGGEKRCKVVWGGGLKDDSADCGLVTFVP